MSRVVVRNVSPEGLHGFRRGQLLLEGLDDALTVVFAPNATGKSTLAKAIGLLMNPKGAGDAVVSGLVVCDGMEDNRSVRRRDEAYPGAPDRPEDYQLDIIRLLSGLDDTERKSLSELVGHGLNIAPGLLPVIGNSPAIKQANEAKAMLVRARQKGDAAADDENRLPRLREQQQQAEEAQRHSEALRSWKDRRTSERRVLELREEVFALISANPGLERQPERAVSTAKSLSKSLADATHGVMNAREALMKVRADGATPERRLTDTDVAALSASVRELSTARQSLRDSKIELQRKSSQLDALRVGLFRLIEEADVPLLVKADLAALSQAADEADAHRTRESELAGFARARDEWLKRSPEPIADAEAAVRAICQWLEAEPIAAEDPRPRILLTLAIVGFLGIALLPGTAIRFGAAILLIAMAVGVWSLVKSKSSEDRRPALAEAAGLPANASPADAANRLVAISAARAHMETARTLETLAGVNLPPMNWENVAANLRLNAANPYQLAAVSRAIADYLRLDSELAGYSAAASDAEAAVENARSKLSRLLESFEFPHDPQAPELAEKAFLDWFERAEALSRAMESESQRREELRRFLAEAGIPASESTDSAVGIAGQLQLLEAREPIVADLRRLQAELTASEDRLACATADPNAVRDALGMEPDLAEDEQIEAALLRLEEVAAHRDEYFQAYVECQKRISDTEKNAALPEAADRYAAAMRGLESKWGECVREAVRYRIKTHLTDRMRTVELPEIIKNANDWVSGFTAGRYRFVLGPAGPAAKEGLGVLTVQDLRTGREQRFGELSTGTKVHLVLALRLGLVERHEMQANAGTRRFPLIADEVMAVSDPDASRALATALVQISGSRQVIVFTNQPDDVHVFSEVQPGVTVKTLGSQIPEDGGSVEVPVYVAPSGPRRLDLRYPIWTHAPEAVLPDHFEVPGDQKHLMTVLEAVRESLNREYPRLDWEHISSASWTDNNFRESIRDAAHKAWGHGPRFLSEVRNLPRMRKATIEEAEGWLTDRNYLVPPPSEAEVAKLVEQCAEGNLTAYEKAHVVRLVMNALQ